MAENVMRQIREELASSPLRMANGLGYDREFDCEALTKALASGLIDNVSRKSEGSRGSSFSGPLGSYFQLAYQSACSQGSSLILVGGLRKIPARRGFIHLATEAAPLKPEWLVEVMPQLCTKKRLSDHRYDSQKDLVVETEEVFFVDLKAGNSPVGSLDKEAAAKTFCDWLADTIVNERRY